ncbi:MAG: glycosyltransferase family 2 protein [Bacteroidales bacterium]
MSNHKLISIISVNYNGLQDTLDMIESVIANVSALYEIIVVDNASRVDETVAIREKYPQVVTIRSEENLGFAGGNNLGIKAAKGEYLFFLNNDTVVKDDSLQYLVNRLESSPKIGAVSPKIKFAWEPYNIQFAGYTRLSGITLRNSLIGFMSPDIAVYNHPGITPYIHGAAFMIKREVVPKAGLMPELFFLYYEELDWSERIAQVGYELWYEPQATVYHKESQSTGVQSPLKVFYMTRNRLIYAVRNRKGMIRNLSIVYQLSVAVTKQNFVYLLGGKFSLIQASLKGVKVFFNTYNKW